MILTITAAKTYPVKPNMPKLSSKATPQEVRLYADQLEAYEAEMVRYKDEFAWYKNKFDARLNELKTRLRDEYDITDAQFFILWNKAYDDGHSEGLQRVVGIFEELYELASEFAALEKG
jgi:hypothetical protein